MIMLMLIAYAYDYAYDYASTKMQYSIDIMTIIIACLHRMIFLSFTYG